MIRSGIFIFLLFLAASSLTVISQKRETVRYPSPSAERRAADLIKKLTLDEKISLLSYDSPGVKRLGIPKYNWWNEALHGVARAGRATVFPQSIALAATFDDRLVERVASAISDEARAKYSASVRNGSSGMQYLGLTFWSPNINIFRDPRWGRGHETYGEDPFLTGQIGSAFVTGLQGNDPRYFKTVAAAKHFAVHSGPEPLRHEFDARVSTSDLRNTYLPAFEKLVRAGVGGVMCSYNRINGTPACGSEYLLRDILRNEWGFKGYIVTDCWALDDIYRFHKFVKTEEQAAALGIKSGINVECGATLKNLRYAIEKGLVSETEIDSALQQNLATLIKLGLLDPLGSNPYDRLGPEVVNSLKNRALAREAAAKSIVLLTNKNKTLPLSTNIRSILVTGPTSADTDVLLANYNGVSGNLVTILEGITNAVSPSTVIFHNRGTALDNDENQNVHWQIDQADAVVAVMGLSPLFEGEQGDAYLSKAGGDKKDISFPAAQLKYLKALREKTKKPIVVVLTAGSAVDLREVEQLADAVLLAWYPGEQGGNAIADVIFGKINPAGRLPVTFYNSDKDLPPFEDYSMKGRTYRYFTGKPLHPFGFGSSYTTFEYGDLSFAKTANGFHVGVDVKNSGEKDGDEVVQVFVRRVNAGDDEPMKSLVSYKRISIPRGKTAHVDLSIARSELGIWDEKKNARAVIPGEYEILIGASSEDLRLRRTIRVN